MTAPAPSPLAREEAERWLRARFKRTKGVGGQNLTLDLDAEDRFVAFALPIYLHAHTAALTAHSEAVAALVEAAEPLLNRLRGMALLHRDRDLMLATVDELDARLAALEDGA